MTHIYRILSFLLFVGFLAGCSSGTQEAVEEQTTFATYTFEAESDGMALTGRLALDILDNGPERLFTGALILEDGTRLLSSGTIRGNFIRIGFRGDNIESLGVKELAIFGWGALEGDGAYAGDFIAEATPMTEEGGPEERTTGTWSATPTSQDDEPDEDSSGGDTGGSEPIDESITLAERYTLIASLGGNSSARGELTLEPTEGGRYEGVWTLEDGAQLAATAAVEGENVEFTFSNEELEIDIVGTGQAGDDGLLTGKYEGEVFGERVTGRSWTAEPLSPDDEPGEDPAPPSDPGDGETEPGTVRVDITVDSENVSGTVTIERILESDEVEVVASSEFASSGQGSSASQTIEQTLEPGDYTLRIAIDGFDSNNVIPFELEPGEDETFNLIV